MSALALTFQQIVCDLGMEDEETGFEVRLKYLDIRIREVMRHCRSELSADPSSGVYHCRFYNVDIDLASMALSLWKKGLEKDKMKAEQQLWRNIGFDFVMGEINELKLYLIQIELVYQNGPLGLSIFGKDLLNSCYEFGDDRYSG